LSLGAGHAPPDSPALDTAAALELFSALVISRAADAELASLQEEGLLRGATRRDPFREAGPVGAAYALNRFSDGSGDVYAPTIRTAGAWLLFGLPLDDFFRAYIEGRVGPARGIGAALHHVDFERGYLAPVTPFGVLAEVAAGLALGFRMQDQNRVAVVLDGEGATSSGAWHEGVVVAAAKRAPLVLVVEASASGDPEHARHTRVERYVAKAPGYGLVDESVSGDDVLEVVQAVRRARARAHRGDGVQMVEVRYEGGDPVAVLGAHIVARGVATADELGQLERETAGECAASVARARASALADLDSLPGVYTDSGPTERRIWRRPPTDSLAAR